MSNNFSFSAGMMSEQSKYQVDATLIKIFLNTVKEGDLPTIINEIEKLRFDVRFLKDSQYDQNVLFYVPWIKDENK
jgi:hypothetical protein